MLSDTIFVTGNTVIDALLSAKDKISNDKKFSEKLVRELEFDFDLESTKYILVTGHRRENFGKGLRDICEALCQIASQYPEIKIIFPMHMNPNVVNPVKKMLLGIPNIYLTKPLDYLSFVFIMDNSYLILTDSGGIQEEAPSLGKPVLVMRDNSERPEAIDNGLVQVVGTRASSIANSAKSLIEERGFSRHVADFQNPYGDGDASSKILKALVQQDML